VGNIFVFTIRFNKKFSGYKNVGGNCPRMLPVATVLTPLSGVSSNWGRASRHNHRTHDWCERARPEKGNAKLGCLQWRSQLKILGVK